MEEDQEGRDPEESRDPEEEEEEGYPDPDPDPQVEEDPVETQEGEKSQEAQELPLPPDARRGRGLEPRRLQFAAHRQAQLLSLFEEGVGGRKKLLEVLLHAPKLDEEQRRLVQCISAYRKMTLARILERHGFTFDQVLGLFRQAGFARTQLRVFLEVWREAPKVVRDTLAAAQNQRIRCPTCRGTGEAVTKVVKVRGEAPVEERGECWRCFGEKLVDVPADPRARELALQMAGVIGDGEGKGPAVQVNLQNNTQVFGSEDLRAFRQASDQVLFPRRG